MFRKLILLGTIGLLLMSGCEKAEEYKQAAKPPESRVVLNPAESIPEKQELKKGPDVGVKRYIATRLLLVVETSEADLEKHGNR